MSFRYWKYCTTMFWCGSKPNSCSSLVKAAGESLLCVRSRSDCSGLPGIIRGMKKLSVIAAHRVRTKNPKRRTRYLIACHPSCLGPHPVGSVGRLQPSVVLLRGLRVQMEQDLLDVRDVVRGRLGVGVGRARPALQVLGVVLEPVARTGGRDHRHVLDHGG